MSIISEMMSYPFIVRALFCPPEQKNSQVLVLSIPVPDK